MEESAAANSTERDKENGKETKKRRAERTDPPVNHQ